MIVTSSIVICHLIFYTDFDLCHDSLLSSRYLIHLAKYKQSVIKIMACTANNYNYCCHVVCFSKSGLYMLG